MLGKRQGKNDKVGGGCKMALDTCGLASVSPTHPASDCRRYSCPIVLALFLIDQLFRKSQEAERYMRLRKGQRQHVFHNIQRVLNSKDHPTFLAPSLFPPPSNFNHQSPRVFYINPHYFRSCNHEVSSHRRCPDQRCPYRHCP